MTAKTYSKRSNAARSARAEYGKTARIGVDFHITGSGPFGFAAGADPHPKAPKAAKSKKAKAAKKAPKAKRVKGEAKLSNQPQMQKIIKLASRVNGASYAELAEALGGLEEHTVRASISRMISLEKIPFTFERVGRTKRVHHPKQDTGA